MTVKTGKEKQKMDAPKPTIPTTQRTATLVVGDGWAAMATVGFLVSSFPDQPIRWLPSKGSRWLSPLPSLEADSAVYFWEELFRRFDVVCGTPYSDLSLREFKGKSFRPASWMSPEGFANREEVRQESLWEAEANLPPLSEARFGRPFSQMEIELREKILQHPAVFREEGIELTGFETDPNGGTSLVLLNGERRLADRVIFADRWSLLSTMSGVPKPVPLLHKRELAGLLQVIFTHRRPMGADVSEGFFTSLHKDAGEDSTRHAWGHFFDEGKRSVWTVLLDSAVTEDNHEIGKKLRRMKQALERMFVGEPWLQTGEKDFFATVASEQLRFEERIWMVTQGHEDRELHESTKLKEMPGVEFMTDAYGPNRAIEMAARSLGAECGMSDLLERKYEFQLDSLTTALDIEAPADRAADQAADQTNADSEIALTR